MRINLAKSAGFCFGVKRALDIAYRNVQDNKQIYMLGDIVHNEDVVKKIEKTGIKKIGRLLERKGGALLIRAHGTGLKTYARAARLGYTIVDATCPMVKEIHKIVEDMHQIGYKIIIIGDKNHEEVRGISGQLKTKALVIDKLKHIPITRIQKIKKACVIAQSTQNLEEVLKIVDTLKKHIADLKFFNTICKPTRTKQEEIRKMPLANDIMLIIGSKKSANTKRLYEISRALNKKSYWINTKEEIKTVWFKGAKNVGITAGASTPEDTIKDIVEYTRLIAN